MSDQRHWYLYVRHGLVLTGLGLLILSAGFFFRWSWAIDLWPWADSRLSHVFISSILASTGAPLIWLGLSGELGASAAGALNLTVTYTGLTAYLGWLYVDQNDTQLLLAAAFTAVGAAANVGIYLWTRTIPIRDPRPLPRAVRFSFALFVAILIPVSVALMLQAEHVFPWPLNPQSSVVYGLIFLGASVYFAHTLVRPSWHNATGQLIGFLAYDLVLIGPYLDHLSAVADDHRASLYVYLAVIVFSGGLATYYLFVNGATRLWPAGQEVASIRFTGATGK